MFLEGFVIFDPKNIYIFVQARKCVVFCSFVWEFLRVPGFEHKPLDKN